MIGMVGGVIEVIGGFGGGEWIRMDTKKTGESGKSSNDARGIQNQRSEKKIEIVMPTK